MGKDSEALKESSSDNGRHFSGKPLSFFGG